MDDSYQSFIDLRKVDGSLFNELFERKLYKSLSIAIASKAGIPTAPSYLILESNINSEIIRNIFSDVMIRVDYTKLNKCKPLGGIILYNFKVFRKLINFLFKIGYYPLIHPGTGYSRFENVYNVNVMYRENKYTLEILGRGFDGTDLRLGDISPHEIIIFDSDFHVLYHKIVDDVAYKKSVQARKEKLKLVYAHQDYMNETGFILSRLDECVLAYYIKDSIELQIPDNYTPISPSLFHSLKYYIIKLKSWLNRLPRSNEFIATFTYLEKHGWLLWDVYGSWYFR